MADETGYAELTVQADMRFAGLVRVLVRQVTAPARLPETQVRKLELAAEEAFTNAVRHAYEPGCGGLASLTVELDRTKVSLSIRDRGIPFDASLEPARNGPHGQGLALIRSVMDEVRWVSLGTEGKELRLTLYLHRDSPASHVDTSGPPVEEEPAPPAPRVNYTIRRFGPDDAIGVVRCFYETWGYSYPSSDFYYPRRIVELNDAGALISAVAVSDPTGEVAGHCSLQPYGSGTYAECGQGVVAPAHRGHALSARLLRFLEQEALRAGLRCLVSHEVTSHPAMQLLVSRVGYKPCALALAAMPATLNFRKMTGTHPQRESCSVSLRYLTPPEASVVCAPSRHREMLRRIYASLGKPVTFESPPSPSGPGKSAVHYNGAWGIGDIHVHRIGTDTAADIRRSLRDLCEIGDTRVVYLALPLDQGGTEDICRAAEEEGFFFAGLGSAPAGDGESLYLQYVDTELDLSLIQIATPMGKEIFEYVAKERLRVGR